MDPKPSIRLADLAHSALVYVEVLTKSVAAAVVGETSTTRTVYGVVVALGLIGIVLVALAVWLIKQTRPERELLAPLELMQDRSWRKQEPAQMRRDLDQVRPPGARPVVRGRDVPVVDAEFEQARPALASFDDLQAQLEAQARRTPPAALSDPLLSAPDPSAPVPSAEPADPPESVASADDTDGVDRPLDAPPATSVPDEESEPDDTAADTAADGSVTHTRHSGSPELAALLHAAEPADSTTPSDDPDPGDPPADSSTA